MNNYFRYLNQKCPICEKEFANNDDIVVCPLCGTPHHRDCYKKNGECGNYDEHNKGFRWTPKENPVLEEATEQPEENVAPETPSAPFYGVASNPLAQFPTEITPEVTTQEVADFVQSKANKYIQNFICVKSNKKAFNWAAFFFTPYWFFYRKMHKLGVIFLAITLLLSMGITFIPSAQKFYNDMTQWTEKYQDVSQFSEEELIEAYEEQASLINENKTGVVIVSVHGAISLALQIFVGLKANKWYYDHTIKNIKEVKSKTADANEQRFLFFKLGGVSIAAVFIAVLANNVIVMAIETILALIK